MTAAQTHAPTSSLERDARRTNEAHAGEVRPGDIAIGVIIGRTSEFFDFFVYAIASVVVFPKLIFPYVDALTGTLYSFAIFALAFVARPFGTVIFTAIDRAYGRGMKLTIALFLLGTSTVAIAFIPSYETIGIASAYFLGILRIGQGLALGGSWDGLASLLALNAPQKRRGYYAMIPQLGAPLGLMVASSLFAYIIANLSAEDFLSWGWRYPFFVAFAINVVALFARLRIVVTPEYTSAFDTQELQPQPILETLRHGGKNIVVGAFAPARQLRVVPHGDGVPAVVGVPVHAGRSGTLSGDRSGRRRVRSRGRRRVRLAGRSHRSSHPARRHRRGHRGVQRFRASVAGRR